MILEFKVYLPFIEALKDEELEVEVDFSPGNPGTMYRSNGDPGDPPEPDEVEIKSAIRLSDGKDVSELLVDYYDEVMDAISEEANNSLAAINAAEADSYYQEQQEAARYEW